MSVPILVALLLVAFWVVFKLFFRIVHMRESFVVERLGSFRAVLGPGLHIVVPILDRVAYVHDNREQVIDIPPQTCITKDNIQVTVDGLVFLKVMNPEKASYGIADYRRASINLAQTTMRAEVGKLILDEAFKERDNLNKAIVKAIDQASEPWGVKVGSYEIRNITPSEGVIHTLEKQMEAERERRAEVTLATAERESKVLISEGIKQEAINLSEGERQRRINLAKGKAREIQLLAQATADGARMVAEASMKPGGQQALKMRLAEQFIGRLSAILGDARVSILPAELAQLRSIVEVLKGGDFPKTLIAQAKSAQQQKGQGGA
jgi:regulator of protease activity HflC (stomatin/prohibitin superfamily)